MLALPVARTTALALLVGTIALPTSAEADQYAKFGPVSLSSSNPPITIHVANDGTR